MKPTGYNAIKPFAERAGQIRMFDYLLHEMAPKTLLGHVYVLNVRDGVLVLAVHHAAIATQIRFQSPKWLAQINSKAQQAPGLPIIRSIETRIVAEPIQPQTKKTHRQLGASTRELLQEMAAHEENEPLARTLRKLAQLGGKSIDESPNEPAGQ
jgi:hypothetical protein